VPSGNELMDDKIYWKVMDDLKKMNYHGRISPYDMGEPTMHPRLKEIIIKTREMFPENVIYIGSNGTLIDAAGVRELLAAGLTQILITCYTEDVYNKFKDMAETTDDGWAKPVGLKSGVPVRLWPVFNEDKNKVFFNRGGITGIGPQGIVHKACDKGIHQTFINYLGDMILCCSDYKFQVVAGNVMDEDVQTLFNKPIMKQYREQLAVGERQNLKLCIDCNFLHDN
jgi:hypothetical protein